MMYEKLVSWLREEHKPHLISDFDKAQIESAAKAIEGLNKKLQDSENDNINLTGWLAEEHAKHLWIPVAERLPEDGIAVNIVWCNHSPVIYYQHIKDKPQTATGVFFCRKWYWWSAVVQDYLAEYGKWEPDEMDAAIEVTHWMPLPEPPEEGEC